MSLAMPVRVYLLLACLVVVPTAARAQGAAMPSCTTLLPAEVIAKVVGEPFKDLGSEVGRSGASDCEWAAGLGTPKARTLSMTFFDAVALKASPGYASADEYFETVVASVESRAPGKREMLPGIGMKAAFVATAPQMLVAVQRKDGVARLVGHNLTKARTDRAGARHRHALTEGQTSQPTARAPILRTLVPTGQRARRPHQVRAGVRVRFLQEDPRSRGGGGVRVVRAGRRRPRPGSPTRCEILRAVRLHADPARRHPRGVVALLRTQPGRREPRVRLRRQSPAARTQTRMAARGRHRHRPARRVPWTARRRDRTRDRSAWGRCTSSRAGDAPIPSSCTCGTRTSG